MADHDSHRERWNAIADVALGALEYIRVLLGDLPVPVLIPEINPKREAEDLPHLVMSIDRVRSVIQDEPISEARQSAFDRIILDWLTAYEMLALTRVAGPAPWRLDCAEYALYRIAAAGGLIETGESDE